MFARREFEDDEEQRPRQPGTATAEDEVPAAAGLLLQVQRHKALLEREVLPGPIVEVVHAAVVPGIVVEDHPIAGFHRGSSSLRCSTAPPPPPRPAAAFPSIPALTHHSKNHQSFIIVLYTRTADVINSKLPSREFRTKRSRFRSNKNPRNQRAERTGEYAPKHDRKNTNNGTVARRKGEQWRTTSSRELKQRARRTGDEKVAETKTKKET